MVAKVFGIKKMTSEFTSDVDKKVSFRGNIFVEIKSFKRKKYVDNKRKIKHLNNFSSENFKFFYTIGCIPP